MLNNVKMITQSHEVHHKALTLVGMLVFFMPLAGTDGPECVVTERTLVALHRLVYLHMSGEGAVGGEAGIAHGTLEIADSHVGFEMGFEDAGRDERLVALPTHKGLLSCDNK